MPFSRFRDTTFSERLKKIRVEKGLTQGALATEAGVSADLVYRWERARHGAAARTLGRVAEVLGVSPAYLRAGTEPRRRRTDRGAERPAQEGNACAR